MNKVCPVCGKDLNLIAPSARRQPNDHYGCGRCYRVWSDHGTKLVQVGGPAGDCRDRKERLPFWNNNMGMKP